MGKRCWAQGSGGGQLSRRSLTGSQRTQDGAAMGIC
jgi:hypothetical protein